MKHHIAAKEIIDVCMDNQKDIKTTKKLMANLRDEHNLKSGGFEAIYDILTSLKDNESKVLETLFFYKINDMDEFNREST